MAATINTAWYDLFSRGARDWLRHNDKVREAVQGHRPDLIAGPDLITGPQERTVQVPVRLLEHARWWGQLAALGWGRDRRHRNTFSLSQ